MDREPYIPYEISDLALKYSVPLLFIGGLVSVIYGQKIMGFLQFVVYATSVVFWSHIGKDNTIRNLDMSCATILLIWGTYVYYLSNVQYIWYYSIGTSICVFVVNEAVFFIGIDFCKTEEWRTYIIYQTVITHMIFLHVLPVFTGIYCVIMRKPPSKIDTE